MYDYGFNDFNIQHVLFCLLKIRCWEVKENGQTIPKAQQSHTGPILDCCWHDVSGNIFICHFFSVCVGKVGKKAPSKECVNKKCETHSRVFLTNIEMFGNVVDHCLECSKLKLTIH